MGKDSDYYKNKQRQNQETLERLLDGLPSCCRELIEFKTEVNGVAIGTCIAYCYDLKAFFRWYYRRKDTKEINKDDVTYDTLNNITKEIFLDFKEYLAFGDTEEKHNSTNKGIARKFATYKNLYKYHLAEGNITNNPLSLIIINRNIHRKDHIIIRLTEDEVNKLLKACQKLTIFKRGRQRTYKKKTQKRDLAMFVLILNTGIRISELIGLDMTDVDLKEMSITIYRKGGFNDKVFFNPGVRDVLKAYLKTERKEIYDTKVNKNSTHADAFFLSIQGKRWTADSIEKTVRQYCGRVIPYKHITPHKLRATYGSILYSNTGDIRLVAEVLGHENINTTIKYYAAMDDGRKKEAAKAVCLIGDLKKKNKKEEAEIKVTTVDTVITVEEDSNKPTENNISVESDDDTAEEDYGKNVITFRGRDT